MAAIREGWDFTGRRVEIWDLGADQRQHPMHVLTVDAMLLLNPAPKKKDSAP
jgi:hypothetical protein